MLNPFENTGTIRHNILTLTPRETAGAVQKGALYVDLRETDFYDYKIPDVPEIFLLPLSVFKKEWYKLPRNRYLILADSSGLKSRKLVSFLKENGFDKAAQMAGGFLEWERDGLPVREDINERLTGACACQLKPRDRLKK